MKVIKEVKVKAVSIPLESGHIVIKMVELLKRVTD